MDYYDVKRLALVLAKQAEIEGMKAENVFYERIGSPVKFRDEDFQDKSLDLQDLAYKHNEQL